MHRSKARSRLALALTILLAGAFVAGGSSGAEPTATWDQARVTGIAKKLAESTKELYDKQYKAPESFAGAQYEHHDFMDTLRQLEQESRHLAASLGKGADEHGTRGSVERIRELNDDLGVDGRSMEFVNPVLNQFAALEDLIRQLLPYYGLQRKP